MSNRCAVVLVLVFAAGCGASKSVPTGEPANRAEVPALLEATKGVVDPALAALLFDHWNWRLEREPIFATKRGDHRSDHKLRDYSLAAHDRRVDDKRGFLERARKLTQLTPEDQITRALFVQMLDDSLASEVCQNHLWNTSPLSNPLKSFNRLPTFHPVRSTKDAQNLLSRYRLIAGSIDQRIARLRLGLSKGLVGNRESLSRMVAMVDRILATPQGEWELTKAADELEKSSAVSDAERAQLAADLRAAVKTSIKPAYSRYRDVIRDELLPKARGADAEGISALPNGAACYRARIRRHLGSERAAADLHALGMREIEKINGEMVALGNKLFGLTDLAAIIDKLRTDPALYYSDKAAILAKARASLKAAQDKAPEFFGKNPKAPCTVVEIPAAQAPFTTIAYYGAPQKAVGKPGEYFINTYKPETRPRFEMEVLAFHEAVPGHHQQIALAHEADELPAFRRFSGSTAFTEGWALYTERLSDEMGLYTGDLDRMGMLSFDAWRASRLVVDTGIHALGWDRARAEKFMLEHTALSASNIRNEVDRYISWPGQALAYKFGQLEIWRMRREAEAALGDKFDIKKFHDTVLENGAVTLPVLEAQVKRWVSATQ